MNKYDSIINKVQIIHNLNRETNLSLHIALKKYEDGNYAESCELLEKHLEKIPSDTAAQIQLCRSYAKIGKYQQAVHLLKSASTSINSQQTFDHYLREIEENQKKELLELKSETANTIKLKLPAETDEMNKDDFGKGKTYEQLLVSETLAKIYISQGEIKEAITVYEKLIEGKPENKQKYLQTIEELKLRLDR